MAEALHHPGPGSMLTEECWEIVISFLYPISFLREEGLHSEDISDAMVHAHFYHHQLFEDALFLGGMHRVSRFLSRLVGDMTVLRSNLSNLHRNFCLYEWDHGMERWDDLHSDLLVYIHGLIENPEHSQKFQRQLLEALSWEFFLHSMEPAEFDDCLVERVKCHFAEKPLEMMEHRRDDPAEDSES